MTDEKIVTNQEDALRFYTKIDYAVMGLLLLFGITYLLVKFAFSSIFQYYSLFFALFLCGLCFYLAYVNHTRNINLLIRPVYHTSQKIKHAITSADLFLGLILLVMIGYIIFYFIK